MPQRDQGFRLTNYHGNFMNITASSNKAEIITAAVELTDWQSDQINQLKERQAILWALVGVLSALLLVNA